MVGNAVANAMVSSGLMTPHLPNVPTVILRLIMMRMAIDNRRCDIKDFLKGFVVAFIVTTLFTVAVYLILQ